MQFRLHPEMNLVTLDYIHLTTKYTQGGLSQSSYYEFAYEAVSKQNYSSQLGKQVLKSLVP